jgi:hypothetical protein
MPGRGRVQSPFVAKSGNNLRIPIHAPIIHVGQTTLSRSALSPERLCGRRTDSWAFASAFRLRSSDLLIRKLFTAGLDTTHVETSGWRATRDMLKSINATLTG